MNRRTANGTINIKLLVAPLLIAAVLGVSLIFARQVRIDARSEKTLEAGLAAVEQENWSEAVKHLRRYLLVNPKDVQTLRIYADACLEIRPLTTVQVAGAISAYSNIIEANDLDHAACEKLAELYAGMSNARDLERIARLWLQHTPEDAKAALWLADALIQQKKSGEAEQMLRALIQRVEAGGEANVEYVRACMRMSGLAAAEQLTREKEAKGKEGSAGAKAATVDPNAEAAEIPSDWLHRAVLHVPDSAEALAYRAQYYRTRAEEPNLTYADREAEERTRQTFAGPAHADLGTEDPNDNDKESVRQTFANWARVDLEKASGIGTDDPQVCLFLASEWIALGGFTQAEAQLQRMEGLPQERIEERFFDENDWVVAKFELAAKLAMRKGASAEAVPLADKVLKTLASEYHRVQVLPLAIPLYAAAGRVLDASKALEEYLALVPKLGIAVEPRRVAWLKGLVEGAANRPYAVIDTLESLVVDNASGAGELRLLAHAYAETGQTARAIDVLTKYIKFYPQEAEAMLDLARLYSIQGDWNKASETAQEAELAGVTDPALRLLRIGAGISSVFAQGQNVDPAALSELSRELASMKEQYPRRVDVRLFQAILAGLLEQPEQVERELKLAIEECDEPLRARMQLVRHYSGSGETPKAIGVCQTACEQHSDIAMPWMTLSDLHVVADDTEAGRLTLDKARNTITDSRQRRLATIKLALLELTRGNRPAGIKLLQDLAGQDAQDVQVRLLLLGTAEVRGDPNTAQELVAGVRKAEGEAGLWWRLHQASLWLGSETWSSRQAEITRLLQHCIDIDPTWTTPVLVLAGMYERLGELTRVEELYRQGLLSNPSATELADRLLALLENQRRFVDAERILRQIGRNPRAQYWRPRVLEGMGDFSRAIEEYRLRVSNDSQDAASRIQLARLIYQEINDKNQALRYLEEARAIAPDSRTLNAVHASILRGEGQGAEALEVLDKYVVDYNNFDTYWLRAVYLAEDGVADRAEADYRKLTTFTENAGAGYELLSNFYAGTDRLAQGITAVEEGLAAYPDNLRLKRRLMQLLFQRAEGNDRKRAVALLAELLKLLPEDPELLTIWTVEKTLEEPTPKALASAKASLEDAVRRDPRYTRAWLMLIEVLMRRGELQAAAQQAVRSLEANPNNAALLLTRARVELVLGRGQTAFNLAQDALRNDPNNLDAFVTLANGALASGNANVIDQARVVFDGAIRRLPASEGLLMARAQIYSALNRPKQAIPALEAYCRSESGSRSVEALVTLADLYRIVGDMEQAERTLLRAEEVAPTSQMVVHARLLLRIAQNRLTELAGISQAYVGAEQQSLAITRRAAWVLWSLDAPELKQQGFRLLEYCVQTWPESVDAGLALAMATYATGQIEQARQLYQNLLKRAPDNVTVLNDLAWILQERDQNYQKALELANRGIQLAPNDENLLDTRAVILTKVPNRLSDAKRDLDTLRRLCLLNAERRPRLARTLVKLARVCVAQGEIAEAKRHGTAALQIDDEVHVLTPEERTEVSDILKMEVPTGQ